MSIDITKPLFGTFEEIELIEKINNQMKDIRRDYINKSTNSWKSQENKYYFSTQN